MNMGLSSQFRLYPPWPSSPRLKVSKVERIVHNPVDLVVEVPRPVVVEKSVQVAIDEWTFRCGPRPSTT